MLYGSEDEARVPLLIDMIIHFIGGMGATAIMLAGPLYALGMPANAILAANILGGVAICALAMFQTLHRTKNHA